MEGLPTIVRLRRGATATSRSRQRGLTLIELLIVGVIAAILIAGALPAFTAMATRNRLAAATNDLVVDLMLARSEAVRRGATVTVCASSDGASCDTANWAAGRLVFVDGGVVGTVEAGDEAIRASGAMTPADTLVHSGGARFVQFFGDGSVPAMFTLTSCHTGASGSVVTVRRVGFVSTAPASVNCP